MNSVRLIKNLQTEEPILDLSEFRGCEVEIIINTLSQPIQEKKGFMKYFGAMKDEPIDINEIEKNRKLDSKRIEELDS